MPKKLYERGPTMPTARQTEEAERAARPGPIERTRDMLRKRIGIPPLADRTTKPGTNGSGPPMKSKFK